MDPPRPGSRPYRLVPGHKPGGDLVIFDGNFIAIRRRDHVLREILAVLERIRPSGEVHSAELQAAKTDIDSQLYFADGLSFDILAGLVAVAGYTNITKHSYTPIRRAQRKVAGPRDWLRTFLTDRFILHAQKPPQAQ